MTPRKRPAPGIAPAPAPGGAPATMAQARRTPGGCFLLRGSVGQTTLLAEWDAGGQLVRQSCRLGSDKLTPWQPAPYDPESARNAPCCDPTAPGPP